MSPEQLDELERIAPDRAELLVALGLAIETIKSLARAHPLTPTGEAVLAELRDTHNRGFVSPTPEHGGTEGFVLVPREPTADMMAVGDGLRYSGAANYSAGDIYVAMLSAAPGLPALLQGGGENSSSSTEHLSASPTRPEAQHSAGKED